MGDHQDCGAGLQQPVFQPFQHFDIQVIGGFIKQQQVGRGKKHPCESHAWFFGRRKDAQSVYPKPDGKNQTGP